MIDEISAAESALVPLITPWMHYSLDLNSQEKEILNDITINANPPCVDCMHFSYYNFADLENLTYELEREIKSYSINQENDALAKNIAESVARIAKDIISQSKYQQAFISVKAHKPVTDDSFDDNYTWHMDATLKQRLDVATLRLSGKIVSSNHTDIAAYQIKNTGEFINFESNFIMTLHGPSTLFYSPNLDSFNQANSGQGTVFISNYDYGAIHSAPKVKHIGTGRFFITITPSSRETILEFSKLF